MKGAPGLQPKPGHHVRRNKNQEGTLWQTNIAMEYPQFSIGNTSSMSPFSIAMLVYRSVLEKSAGFLKYDLYLEPQTTIYKWMFGETTIFYVMTWNPPVETTIKKWLFGVPGSD